MRPLKKVTYGDELKALHGSKISNLAIEVLTHRTKRTCLVSCVSMYALSTYVSMHILHISIFKKAA